MSRWLRITGPTFVGSADLDGDRIANIAPVMNYARGWDVAKFREYAKRRHWRVEVFVDDPDAFRSHGIKPVEVW